MREALPWLDRRIVFFGGKGGVGKTTCATAFALSSADAGIRTLLVSTDPAHSTSDILRSKVGSEERRLAEHLWAVEIDAEAEAEEYIERVRQNLMRVTPARLRDEMQRQIEIAQVSPGAAEAALFDKVADLVLAVKDQYDRVVFDTAPTGHTLRLLTLPELLRVWTDGLLERRRRVNELSKMWRQMTVGGSPDEELTDPVERVLSERRRKFYQMREILLAEDSTAFAFVITAERLPILETAKAIRLLRKHGVPVAGLIVNRLLPDESQGHPFFSARKTQESRYLAEIDEEFRDLPSVTIPLLERDVAGEDSLREIAGYMQR